MTDISHPEARTVDVPAAPPSPERTLPPAPSGPEIEAEESPEAPEAMAALREDIERTRDRMSRTIDRIEGRITDRRDEVWSKATLQGARTTIASEPWKSLLIAFAAGYVVAALRD